MTANTRSWIETWFGVSLLLALVAGPAAQTPQPGGTPDPQAVSQTGLLPIYGVDIAIDLAWVNAQVPSESQTLQNFGVSAAFQQIWDALKPSGFGVIRFPIDVRDPAAANRIANLCLWARANDAKLVPILMASDRGEPASSDFQQKAATCVGGVVANLQRRQQLEAYAQVLAYQLENKLNHPGWHGASALALARDGSGAPAGVASQPSVRGPDSGGVGLQASLLAQVARAVRAAEREHLKDTGLDATPLMVSASFDAELVRTRAIAGVALSETAFAQARAALVEFLRPLSGASEIDLIDVEWFPGSVSAGGPEKFGDLLRGVTSNLTGKQFVVTTGFSTAFRSLDEQQRFYPVAFSNLADYRAAEGLSSPFVGAFFHEATNGSTSISPPPAPDIDEQIARWDWSARADDLMRMWEGGASSTALSWWLAHVENSMGLLGVTTNDAGVSSIVERPAQQGLQQIAGAVSDATAALASQASATDLFPSGTPSGVDPSASPSPDPTNPSQPMRERFQSTLMNLLDRVLERVGTMTFGGSGASNPANPYPPDLYPPASNPAGGAPAAGAPSIVVAREEVRIDPVSPSVGVPASVDVTLRNSGVSDAFNLTVVLVDETTGGLLGMETQAVDVAVPRSGRRDVRLPWSPQEPGTYRVTVMVGDATGVQIAPSLPLGAITVAPRSASEPGVTTSGGSGGVVQDPSGSTGSDQSAQPGADAVKGWTRVDMPLGLPVVSPFRMRTLMASAGRGPASSVGFSLTNSYRRALPNIRVTLLVDGKPMQTRVVGTLLPRQSRSLEFPNVAFEKSGPHDLKVAVESAGPSRLAGSVTARVSLPVAPASTGAPSGVRGIVPEGTSLRPGAAPGAVPARTGVRPALPPEFKVGRTVAGSNETAQGSGRGATAPVLTAPAPPVRGAAAESIGVGDRSGRVTGASGRPASAGAAADLALTMTASPNPVVPGAALTYMITVVNHGPSDSGEFRLTVPVPARATLQEFRAPRGSSGNAPPSGGTGTITCTNAGLPASSSSVFTLIVRVDPGTPNGASIETLARVSSRVPEDPHLENNRVSATATIQTAQWVPSLPDPRTPSRPVRQPGGLLPPVAEGGRRRVPEPSSGGGRDGPEVSSGPKGRAGLADPRDLPAVARPDVGINQGEIRLDQTNPAVWVLRVPVHNYGKSDALRVEVKCMFAGANVASLWPLPQLRAGGSDKADFRIRRPVQSGVFIADCSVDAPGDANPSNNHARFVNRFPPETRRQVPRPRPPTRSKKP